MKLQCPKCNSEKVNQYRMPTGLIWCEDCGFRVEEKSLDNPFIIKEEHPKPEKIFYDEIYTLVNNLIAENKLKDRLYGESSFGHSAKDVACYFSEKGLYILEKMNDMKHLLDIGE